MSFRVKKIHPALKHAAYSATTLLPGEDSAAFEKLHRSLIAEFKPAGALEENIVDEMAHLMWRRQNLAIFRIAERARAHREAMERQIEPGSCEHQIIQWYEKAHEEERAKIDADVVKAEQRSRIVEEQIRNELGDYYELSNIGEPATLEGLAKELDLKERLDGMIYKCLKQLLAVRGVKSLSPASSSVSTPQISGPRKVG
jgi:hypothetical protein